jgi:hypothetical protein
VREVDHLEDLGVNGRIILKLSSRSRMGGHGVEPFERSNEYSGP